MVMNLFSRGDKGKGYSPYPCLPTIIILICMFVLTACDLIPDNKVSMVQTPTLTPSRPKLQAKLSPTNIMAQEGSKSVTPEDHMGEILPVPTSDAATVSIVTPVPTSSAPVISVTRAVAWGTPLN